MNENLLESAARLVCLLDPRSPDPDAPILIGTKQARAWEPRATILRQAIEGGLFCHPPKLVLTTPSDKEGGL